MVFTFELLLKSAANRLPHVIANSHPLWQPGATLWVIAEATFFINTMKEALNAKRLTPDEVCEATRLVAGYMHCLEKVTNLQ